MSDDLDLGNISFTGEVPKDPTPNTKTKKSTGRPVGRPSAATKKSEVVTELEGFLKLANLGLMSRDLHEVYDGEQFLGYETCLSVYVTTNNRGLPILTDEGKTFCDAAADIIVDSPFLMKMLDSGDKAGKWLRLVMALQPLVMGIISNHRIGPNRGVSESS